MIQSIGEYTNYQLCVDLEGHGREPLDSNLDLTRSIGWFTSIYPVYLKLSDPNNIDKSIKEVKEQLRQVPENGITYGIACYIKKIITKISSRIAFNYLGRWDTTDTKNNIVKFEHSNVGSCFDERNRLFSNIDINGQMLDGILSFTFLSNYKESKKDFKKFQKKSRDINRSLYQR